MWVNAVDPVGEMHAARRMTKIAPTVDLHKTPGRFIVTVASIPVPALSLNNPAYA